MSSSSFHENGEIHREPEDLLRKWRYSLYIYIYENLILLVLILHKALRGMNISFLHVHPIRSISDKSYQVRRMPRHSDWCRGGMPNRRDQVA